MDSNVVLYAVGHDEDRTELAEALLAQGGVISVQVLNEVAAVARRKLGMSWAEIGEVVAALRVFCTGPVALTVETHDAGRHIAARYGFSIYDGLIVSAALQARCTTLYSEDFQDGQLIEGTLTVRNPFSA